MRFNAKRSDILWPGGEVFGVLCFDWVSTADNCLSCQRLPRTHLWSLFTFWGTLGFLKLLFRNTENSPIRLVCINIKSRKGLFSLQVQNSLKLSQTRPNKNFQHIFTRSLRPRYQKSVTIFYRFSETASVPLRFASLIFSSTLSMTI